MTPTPKLRFVLRAIPLDPINKSRILQQWWETPAQGLGLLSPGSAPPKYVPASGEWRDIPLEEE